MPKLFATWDAFCEFTAVNLMQLDRNYDGALPFITTIIISIIMIIIIMIVTIIFAHHTFDASEI